MKNLTRRLSIFLNDNKRRYFTLLIFTPGFWWLVIHPQNVLSEWLKIHSYFQERTSSFFGTESLQYVENLRWESRRLYHNDILGRIFYNKLTVLSNDFLAALLFRFWMLPYYPVHLSVDETAIGYNAYSILKTGKDEHGERFSLAFKSVGDYKPPVDIYLTVPSIAIFGLSEFAVRFPVALLGALTPLFFLLLTRELGIGWLGSSFSGFWLAILPLDKIQEDRIIKKINFLNGILGFLFVETRNDGRI